MQRIFKDETNLIESLDIRIIKKFVIVTVILIKYDYL